MIFFYTHYHSCHTILSHSSLPNDFLKKKKPTQCTGLNASVEHIKVLFLFSWTLLCLDLPPLPLTAVTHIDHERIQASILLSPPCGLL